MTKSKFLKAFKDRGFFHQCTDEASLDALLYEGEQSGQGVTAYIGFDCTATSLHVGSLMQIMVLRLFKECGHNPIILLGGATTKIGDPSGKDESRPILSDADIAKNTNGIAGVFTQFGLDTATMVNNDDWISKLSLIDFLGSIGRHFSVNRMLTFDSVKTRLEREEEMNFVEFTYMMMQALDFVELNKKYGCRLQIGGSDQWGNIVNGIDLNRRIKAKENNIRLDEDCSEDQKSPALIRQIGKLNKQLKNEQALIDVESQKDNKIFGLTTPLITTSSGAKMGKSVSGAVWLSPEVVQPSGTQTTSYDYWQFWRNTEDADVFKFMRLFTEIDVAEIARMEKDMQGAAINDAKKILANEATRICHGAEAAKHAAETAQKVFEQGGVGDDLPTFEISKAELEAGISAFKILHMAGLAESGGKAKDLIKGGGAKVNDVKFESEGQLVGLADANAEGIIKLSAGKKKHALVKVV